MLRAVYRAGHRLARVEINTAVLVTASRVLCTTARTPHVREYTQYRRLCSGAESPASLDPYKYEQVCNETLESLCEYFEELCDSASHLRSADVTFSDGVLTVHFGAPYGSYVINRQAHNQQIWLSSPVSGPKRYDLVLEKGGYWVYRHDGVTLHQLLQKEISVIVEDKCKVDFSKCAHSLF